MKLGFIGIGNMATAIINGIEDKNSILISARTYESSLNKAHELGVNAAKNHRDCVASSDIVFLCVKPEMMNEILLEIKDAINDQTLVSIAAKKTIASITSVVGDVPVIRVMPNLNVAIKEGISSLSKNASVSDAMFTQVSNVFDQLGGSVTIEERQISGFIGIAGSAPAFVFKFIDALAKSVQDEGFSHEEALEIACKTISGSANYLATSNVSPDELIRRVCSPGGTTIEGVNSLNNDQFDEVIYRAVQATIEKDKKG